MEDFLKHQLEAASKEEVDAFQAEAEHIKAARVVSHMPRERVYDDRQDRIVAGRLWLISFTDLFSILLCMFILVYTMKDPDIEKVTAMMGARGGGGGYPGSSSAERSSNYKAPEIARASYGDAINLDYLIGVLNNTIAQAKLSSDVKIEQVGDHLNLVIDDDKLFAGNAVSESGMRILKDLAPRLQLLSNRIELVGISGDWAESIRLAGNVATVFRDSGYRKPFAILGTASGGGASLQIRVEADDGRLR